MTKWDQQIIKANRAVIDRSESGQTQKKVLHSIIDTILQLYYNLMHVCTLCTLFVSCKKYEKQLFSSRKLGEGITGCH